VKSLAAIALTAGAFGLLAPGSTNAAAGAAAGPGDMASMRFMTGTWVCSGKALDGTAFSITQTTTIESGRLVTRDNQGNSTTLLWWDATKKQWIETSESSNGSSTQTSPGWNGNMLVFVGTISITGAPATVPYRGTTTKLSETKTGELDEIGKPDGGGWITFDTAVCEKR
jgi:hypothetical protein